MKKILLLSALTVFSFGITVNVGNASAGDLSRTKESATESGVLAIHQFEATMADNGEVGPDAIEGILMEFNNLNYGLFIFLIDSYESSYPHYYKVSIGIRGGSDYNAAYTKALGYASELANRTGGSMLGVL